MMKIILLCLCLVQLIYAGEFIDYPTPGRHNKLYVPSANGTKPLPLFVMLPGCTQTPTDCADGIKMNIYGERFGFYVLYAQQPLIDNGMLCWNWFLSFDQERGKGEPEAIANMILSLYGKYQIDSSQVFVGGASAGAAMAVIMGVTYPDIFSAVLCAAGVEYKAASDSVFAGWVGVKGGPNPITQGHLIYKTMGPYARPQKVMVVQGLDDPIVWKINSEQVITSFATSLDLTFGQGTEHGYITNVPTTTTPGQVPNGHAYTVYTYADSQSGATYITYVTVNGEGHAWSGGSKNGTFTDPRGPDISLMMVNFFLGLNSTLAN